MRRHLGALTAVPITLVVSGFTGFTSPSGNIGCMIESTYVRCDIAQRDWSPPSRPPDCPTVTGYGQGIELSAGRRPQFVCAGDTAYSNADPLAYGDSISLGVLRCTSAESGINCLDTGTGHGFSISRQGYQLF
jgi:hypothetical protein